jgi:hypothetical protein
MVMGLEIHNISFLIVLENILSKQAYIAIYYMSPFSFEKVRTGLLLTSKKVGIISKFYDTHVVRVISLLSNTLHLVPSVIFITYLAAQIILKILLLSLRVFLVLITTIIIDQESDVLNIMYLL